MTNHDSSKFLRRADLLANPDISQTNMHINTDKTDLDLLDYLLTPPADGDFYFGQVFPLLSSQGTLEFSPADIIKIGNPTVPKVTRNNKVSKRTRKKDRVPKPESGLSAYKEKDRGIDLGLDPGLDPELAEKRKKQNEAARRSREKKQTELRTCHEELARVKKELQVMTERVRVLEEEIASRSLF